MVEMQSGMAKLAVLIDADNASADLIEFLLKEITKYGTAHVKRIYGDWTNSQLTKWKPKLNQFAIQPIQQFAYTVGKNATDSALIIDAMDLLYTENFDGFCIVSSDSDFTRLASRIREAGLVVYGFGEKKTPEAFISACDKFIYTEILRQLRDSSESDLAEHKVDKSSAKGSLDATTSQKLNNNSALITLLKDAYEAVDEEDGWVHLGVFGAQLTKLSPSFDARNYHYKKLSELIRAIDLFEVRETPHSKSSTVKDLHIRLKP
ncbi:MAG: NYN domain-containing protein [Leptolyngbyaceae cyanobacterium CAN_BIN12]|nr:NYN domain-containing protein [Leptolyngbyaceae cyanobacterium CAN_BIN12]